MATLSLKNVPEAVVSLLRSRATRNRRSLNREAIACLELAVGPRPAPITELRAFVEELRSEGVWVLEGDVERYVNGGRL